MKPNVQFFHINKVSFLEDLDRRKSQAGLFNATHDLNLHLIFQFFYISQ